MAGHSGSGLPSILTGRFSQDSSCLAVGTATGFQLYTCEPFALTATCNRGDDGGVRVLEMLFSSSLVAFVGAGSFWQASPRAYAHRLHNSAHRVTPAMWRRSSLHTIFPPKPCISICTSN
eukprot:3884443-Pleurochrysis_carterae.AAC.2